jgi:hypothetical protein
MAIKTEAPYFDFNISMGGGLLNCKAIMYPTSFEILLNSTKAADLILNDDWRWMPAHHSKLPEDVIEEIGNKIESRYM